MIAFHAVGKEYRPGEPALDGIDFRVEKGEFLFVVGPSGAGKSTLLKLIYMEERPTRGEVVVAGLSSRQVRRRDIFRLRRRVGVIFQDFRLLGDRTAVENVGFSLEVIGAPRREIGRRALQALAEVGLADRRDRFPDQLSGGERQRVSIARALVREPSILLADEPTGNLDPGAAEEVMALLGEVNMRGTAVIVATHEDRLGAGARMLCLEQGRVLGDVGS